MVAGLERYYQIARCFRDEDFRADRQPEFTQLDVEMSFCTPDDIQALIEELHRAAVARRRRRTKSPLPIPRMTYAEAMRRFGIDRPDLRFGCELVDFTEYFADTPFRIFRRRATTRQPTSTSAPWSCPAAPASPAQQLDAWQDWARSRGARGLAYVLVGDDGELGGPVAKNLVGRRARRPRAHAGAAPGDCIFFAAGQRDRRARAAGGGAARGRRALRSDRPRRVGVRLGSRRADVRRESIDRNPARDRAGPGRAIHHPFTAPTSD